MSECRSEKLTTLYGSKTDRDKIIGYCRYHHRHLTVTQLKNRGCLGKQCGALKKWEHPFWEEREKQKEIKAKKKEAGIPAYLTLPTDKSEGFSVH